MTVNRLYPKQKIVRPSLIRRSNLCRCGDRYCRGCRLFTGVFLKWGSDLSGISVQV